MILYFLFDFSLWSLIFTIIILITSFDKCTNYMLKIDYKKVYEANT